MLKLNKPKQILSDLTFTSGFSVQLLPLFFNFPPLPDYWFICKQRWLHNLPATAMTHGQQHPFTPGRCCKGTAASIALQVNPCVLWFREDLAYTVIIDFILLFLKTLLFWSDQYIPAVDALNYRGGSFSLLLLMYPKFYLKPCASPSLSPPTVYLIGEPKIRVCQHSRALE